MSPSIDTATSLISELNSLASQVSSRSGQNARVEALQVARRLVTELEQPENTAVDMVFFVSCVADERPHLSFANISSPSYHLQLELLSNLGF